MPDDPAAAPARLVAASMVEVGFKAGTRYRMLKTLRTSALDRLAAAGEADAAERHLVGWAVGLTSWDRRHPGLSAASAYSQRARSARGLGAAEDSGD